MTNPQPPRLDQALVALHLFATRAKAQEAIEQGRIIVNGTPITKASYKLQRGQQLAVKPTDHDYVTRAGNKLVSALTAFNLSPTGTICLDAGCAHGGFTDVLLQHDAAHVIAVDVATDQFDRTLRADERVTVLEQTNIRYLTQAMLPTDWQQPNFFVADLSFISLTLVLERLVQLAAPVSTFLPMVKPQFEVGKAALSKQGVVKDPSGWEFALYKVLEDAFNRGLILKGIAPSRVLGPKGNVEFFLWLETTPVDNSGESVPVAATITAAIAEATELASAMAHHPSAS